MGAASPRNTYIINHHVFQHACCSSGSTSQHGFHCLICTTYYRVLVSSNGISAHRLAGLVIISLSHLVPPYSPNTCPVVLAVTNFLKYIPLTCLVVVCLALDYVCLKAMSVPLKNPSLAL
jgi:hypothetical protein